MLNTARRHTLSRRVRVLTRSRFSEARLSALSRRRIDDIFRGCTECRHYFIARHILASGYFAFQPEPFFSWRRCFRSDYAACFFIAAHLHFLARRDIYWYASPVAAQPHFSDWLAFIAAISRRPRRAVKILLGLTMLHLLSRRIEAHRVKLAAFIMPSARHRVTSLLYHFLDRRLLPLIFPRILVVSSFLLTVHSRLYRLSPLAPRTFLLHSRYFPRCRPHVISIILEVAADGIIGDDTSGRDWHVAFLASFIAFRVSRRYASFSASF